MSDVRLFLSPGETALDWRPHEIRGYCSCLGIAAEIFRIILNITAFYYTLFEKNICERLLLILHEELCDSAGRERHNLQQLPKLIKIYFYNLASLTYFCKWSHPPAVKLMPKVISGHTKNVKLYINLAPSLFTMKSLLYLFKLVLEALSLSAWVKHQKVKLF